MKTQARLRLLSVTLSASLLAAGAPRAYLYGLRRGEEQGPDRTRALWDSTFTERGRVPPPEGPRDGVWSTRLPIALDPRTHVRCGPVDLPELHVDAEGLQHVRFGSTRVLVLGGSCAAGVGASTEARTWWGIIAQRDGWDCYVAATPSWKSWQEVNALLRLLPILRPSLVLTLDGLNDLTVDPAGDPVETYCRNMRIANSVCRALGVKFVPVLQPGIFEREEQPELERCVLPSDNVRAAALRVAYARIRAGLGIPFVDASRAFAGEAAPTFIDLWHFSDPGQEILANLLSSKETIR